MGSSSDASSESGSESGSSAGQSSSTPLYQEHGRDSDYSSSDSSAHWPEWDAPAWAAHRFNEDEGWESCCDGVQDVIFEGEVGGLSLVTIPFSALVSFSALAWL
jgi:hypothetical protein